MRALIASQVAGGGGAPCAGFQSREEYHGQLAQIALFLDGKSDQLVKQLRQQMLGASQTLEYESAARYRDRLEAIETMAQRQKMQALGKLDQDLFGLARADGQAIVKVFNVREGQLSGSENFELTGLNALQSDADVLNAFVPQYYTSATHIPREVFVPAPLQDAAVVEQWLTERRGSRVSVRIPQRGKQRQLLAQAAANAQETMRSLRIKLDYDAERTASLLQDLQSKLELPAPPDRIECYDISNIQGKHPVGSMVVFEQGRPKPAHYRHFRIKSVMGANDFAMLQEVLRRRFGRYARTEEGVPQEPSFSRIPQLLLIDGLCRSKYVLGFPDELLYRHVLPGAAVSLLVGNLFYSWQALRPSPSSRATYLAPTTAFRSASSARAIAATS